MKTIVVNNPAARSSGALTILKEFLEKTSNLKCDNKFIVFVSLEELKKYETDKLKIIVIPPQGLKSRILWDNWGLKKYLNNNKIEPDIFLSIQNTGVNLPKNIPQIIYYHQLLSLCKNNWNFFDKEERIYWQYEKIYPFFIRQYLNRVKSLIVQTEWVKKSFSEKFQFPLDNIYVEKTKINLPNIENVVTIPKEKFRIFYPATPLIYKNHRVIIEALGELKKEIPDFENKIECIFTFSKGESTKIDKLIMENNLNEEIKLIGKIPYEKVLEYYKSSDLLVFPSYIETVGLPLVEAKLFEISILVSDMSYSKNLMRNYKNINFVDYKNTEEWSNYIKIYMNGGENK